MHESNGIDIIIALVLSDISPLSKHRMDLVLELKVWDIFLTSLRLTHGLFLYNLSVWCLKLLFPNGIQTYLVLSKMLLKLFIKVLPLKILSKL